MWKFNNSLLSDLDFIKLINDTIDDTVSDYSVPIYNKANLKHINSSEIQFTINDQLFLETLLMNIRGKTISYSSYKKKKTDKKERDLINQINILEDDEHKDIEAIEIKKGELQSIREIKLNGNIIRSRANWITNGEKPSKYFCGLENINFTSKIIPKIETENELIITDQKQILKEVELFYRKLYSENINLTDNKFEEYFKDITIPKLSIEESTKLEGLITYSEAFETLKNMKNNKSPGSDGFTTEFLKCFWNKLGYFIIRALNYGYINNELSITQKHGIITCLPKGDKPRHFLKNWRPLTLLNVIYKIASGVISKRFKTVLNTLISEDQTGFISGRYIGENTRLIYDIMHYTEHNNIPGLLMLIDFEKAFDTISWNFIQKTLKIFNFGNSIQKWVRLFQNNIYSTVNQGGNFSKNIFIKR